MLNKGEEEGYGSILDIEDAIDSDDDSKPENATEMQDDELGTITYDNDDYEEK